MSIRIGSKRLMWNFNVADVEFNILGADFLAHHNLLVDMRLRRLVDPTTFECFRTERLNNVVDGAVGTHCISVAKVSRFSNVLADYPSITKPEVFNAPPKDDIEHFID